VSTLSCAKCGNQLRGHFKIEHIDPNGNIVLSAALCSVACAIPWFYSVAMMTGAMGVAKLRGALGGLLEAVTGPKTPGKR